MTHTTKDQLWKDEAGQTVPFSRVSALERKKEREASAMLKAALSISGDLKAYKERTAKICNEIFLQAMDEAGADGKKAKGNFTWFNFDRSIRVEVTISDRIDFDDATIQAAKQKLEDYLNENLTSLDEALRSLITSAFETSRGKLDAKKVLGLLKHKARIKAHAFQDAMALIEKSIRRPDSKTYYRISQRNTNGEYEIIDLNFSSL